ncbi:MAG: outer membrane protein transport protein [Polyangiales bacterium]
MGMLSRACSAVLLFACIVGLAERADAAGVEDSVTGAEAIGRSANYVRANDALAVWQNPANLAIVPGKELTVELRMSAFHGCFDRARDPNIAAANGYLANESFDEVCNDGGPQFAGTLGFAMALPRGFGFGVGLFTPGGGRKTEYGSDAINTLFPASNEAVPVTSGARESPNRYLLLDRDVLAAFLMAGVGYQPNRFVRFGVSVGGGVVDIKYRNVTSVRGGTFADQEAVSDVKVVDAFVPRATLSAAVTPLDALDVMASFTWTDDIEAEGTVDVTANGFSQAPRGNCADAAPGPRCRASDVTLKVPYQRFEAVLGARYAQRRGARDRTIDPLKDEVWDVELNLYWSQTSHVKTYALDIYDPITERRGVAFNSAPGVSAIALPATAAIPHNWKDTFGARLGGDWNVLAERLAVRLGVAYESRAVDPKNLTLDYWPLSRFTLSLGATVAVANVRIHAGYAHVFQESVDVAVGEGNIREIAAIDAAAAQSVNEGSYDSSVDVFSLGANVRF